MQGLRASILPLLVQCFVCVSLDCVVSGYFTNGTAENSLSSYCLTGIYYGSISILMPNALLNGESEQLSS